MAHGIPGIAICHDCKQYKQIGRFQIPPNCPTCGKKTEYSNKESIREKYDLSVFYDWRLHYDHWVVIDKTNLIYK